MNLTDLTGLIQVWAQDRDLEKADPTKQILKLGEEFGELCQAIAKNKTQVEIEEEIGDMYVVLTILSMQLDLDIEDCIAFAYEKIANRKGKTINGMFIKESDLNG